MEGSDLELPDDTNWIDELKKCQDSPYYFYTNYVLVNGKKPETWLTQQQFDDLYEKFKSGNFLKHGRQRKK